MISENQPQTARSNRDGSEIAVLVDIEIVLKISSDGQPARTIRNVACRLEDGTELEKSCGAGTLWTDVRTGTSYKLI